MSVLRQFVQSSVEVKKYTIGYSNWLDAGEALAAVEAAVTPVGVPPFEVVVDFDAISNIVQVLAGPGGIEGQTYEVTILITTTEGQKKQDCLLFTIVDSCTL